MDNQTAADAYNVRVKRQFSGALTFCLLLALEKDKRVLNVMKHLRAKEKGFTQYPMLSSRFRVGNNYKLQ
jgi:hypothetical protein